MFKVCGTQHNASHWMPAGWDVPAGCDGEVNSRGVEHRGGERITGCGTVFIWLEESTCQPPPRQVSLQRMPNGRSRRVGPDTDPLGRGGTGDVIVHFSS